MPRTHGLGIVHHREEAIQAGLGGAAGGVFLNGLVDVLEHPNQERYAGQMIYEVDIEQYVYLVPFVPGADGTRFLKTIIPSRKATRDYRRGRSS